MATATFYDYFKENMEDLGLPAPDTLFKTVGAAVGSVSAILAVIDKLGKTATIGEIIGATTGLELLGAIAGLTAAFYVGACIGSIAVATGRSVSNGSKISDVLASAQSNQIYRPWLPGVLTQFPGIVDTDKRGRQLYKSMMVA